MPEEGVNPFECPEEVRHLWMWFKTLHNRRPSALSGIGPLLESEIRSFLVNRDITLEGWELDALLILDQTARESA